MYIYSSGLELILLLSESRTKNVELIPEYRIQVKVAAAPCPREPAGLLTLNVPSLSKPEL